MASYAASTRFHAGGRVAWLAHRSELLDQAANALRAFGCDVGVHGLNPEARAQVCGVQALLSRGQLPAADLVIADEAHHFVEDNDCARILETYRQAGKRILGATATPERADGRGLGSMFDTLVVAAQIRELIALDLLVPCAIAHPPRKLKADQIWRTPVLAYEESAPGSRAVVFAPHERACEEYAQQFRDRGHRCAIVLGTTRPDHREARLRAFADGEIKILINIFVLTEGWDCPATDCVIVARGCSSQSMLLQMIGRGMRTHCPTHKGGRIADGTPCQCQDRKRGVSFLDLRGVIFDFGAPDVDRIFSLDGRGIQCPGINEVVFCKLCRQPKDGPGPCAYCGMAPGAAITPDQVGDRPLDRYEGLKNAGPGKKTKVLAGLIRKARANNYKSAWVTGAALKMLGHRPSARDLAQAEALLANE
jgi:hypothetical protein